MSWNPSLEPGCPDAIDIDAIETLIVPRARDLGDFEVRRALPAPKRQMVGPFIFFDQAGPAEFVTGKGVDVRPHPHIGLALARRADQGRHGAVAQAERRAGFRAGDLSRSRIFSSSPASSTPQSDAAPMRTSLVHPSSLCG